MVIRPVFLVSGVMLETPRFPLRGSFKGDIDIGVDIDMEIN